MAEQGRGGAWVLGKYLLFQIPSWVVVGLLLAGAVVRWDLSIALASGLFAAWVVKDFALFPLFRRAYEPGDESTTDALIGARGIATRPVDPSGYVRIGAELWKAAAASGVAPIPRGAAVRVRAVNGLTLVVEPDSARDPGSPADGGGPSPGPEPVD